MNKGTLKRGALAGVDGGVPEPGHGGTVAEFE
jgi:hypothetical protein